jgi:hypothetical protein
LDAAGFGCNNTVLALIPAVQEDDHNTLPDEVLLKTLFNYADGLNNRTRGVLRRHGDKEIDLADAHQLAKQIIGQKGIFGQSA